MVYRRLLPERRATPRGVVYLLHFSKPFGHAQHYLGFTEDLEERLESHRKGQGSKFMAKVAAAGITFTLARTWPDSTLRDEYRLKNHGGARRFCPICKSNEGVRSGTGTNLCRPSVGVT